MYVDGGNQDVVNAVAGAHPDVRLSVGEELLGPGGARGRLIEAARHDLVASFDDDSFPAHEDYFARVMKAFEVVPDAAVISAGSNPWESAIPEYFSIGVPSGCGCIFRKDWFQRTKGFVPLPVAYGMEEVDIGIQLHAIGGIIVRDPFLRVLHDKEPPMRVDPAINALVIANTALLPFLRFPWWLWPIGTWQIISRLTFLISKGWTEGILAGLKLIPRHLAQHATFRSPMPSRAVLSWLWLRRHPLSLGIAEK